MRIRFRVVRPQGKKALRHREVLRVWIRHSARREQHAGQAVLAARGGKLTTADACGLFLDVKDKLAKLGAAEPTCERLLDGLWARLIAGNHVAKPEDGAPHRPDSAAGRLQAEWDRRREEFASRVAEVSDASTKKTQRWNSRSAADRQSEGHPDMERTNTLVSR